MTLGEYMFRFFDLLRRYSQLTNDDLASRVALKTSTCVCHTVEIYIDGVIYMITSDFDKVKDHVYAVANTISWYDVIHKQSNNRQKPEL